MTGIALGSRLPGVGTTIFTTMSRLATERGAINLGQGVPDFSPPEALVECVVRRLRDGYNQYAPMPGTVELREAIATQVKRHYGRAISPETDVTVTVGATEALCSTIEALVGPGDEVVVFDPAYDSYVPVITLCGARAVRLPLGLADFGVDWDRLACSLNDRTRLVIVNTPHNPSGALWSWADFNRLADMLRPTAALVVCDEVYEHMVFDGRRFESVHRHEELAARAVVVSSFGKTLHATGWRTGYAVAPAALTAEIRKVHQFNTFTVATPLQLGIADFTVQCPHWADDLPMFYQRKRDLLVSLLRQTRLRCVPAASTYFQLVDYSAVSDATDAEFAMHLLNCHGVATIPLSPFYGSGKFPGRLVRLCVAKHDDTLRDAAARLAAL